jgi:large subunit ribosomal protein L23
MKVNNVLVQPVISEKSYKAAQDGIYMFIVDAEVNKNQVKEAVEKQFKVTVTAVKTITTPGKRVRFGKTRKPGRRSDTKKAVVRLKAGDKISIFEG